MRPELAVLTVLAWCSHADAQLTARADLDRYIAREYVNNAAFVAVGALSVGAGAWMLTRDDPFAQGVGYPWVIVGSVQVVIGGIYLGITPSLHARRARQIASDPEGYRREEGARIGGVVGAFPWFLVADSAVTLTGAALWAAGRAGDDDTMAGVGIGCLSAGAVEIALDATAYVMGRQHRDAVRGFRVAAGPSYLGLAGAF